MFPPPFPQWFTVYNAHRPMKQRYHYNVANNNVDKHVEKGNLDGLFISSVACCQELWALIMDAGTGFTAQVGEVDCWLVGGLHHLFTAHGVLRTRHCALTAAMGVFSQHMANALP